ncbi:MAG TPA: hypothetical protein VMU89_10460 [Thermomicrobiaceae bacterium]|nr:hypothetical protein [Thermomicrobiaceae bacterium]
MNRKRWMQIGGALVGVVLAGALVAGTVFADSPATPSTISSGSSPTTQGTGQLSAAQLFVNRLAQNLGISTSQLQTGLKTTEVQSVADAVAAGKINAQQGATLTQKINASNGIGFFRFVDRVRDRISLARYLKVQIGTEIANDLGMTPKDLKAELQSGQTLSQVITAHGKTTDQVVNDVVAKARTRLDASVANGNLTQTRENQLLANLQTRLTNAINNNTLGTSSQPSTSATPTP